MAQIVKLLSTPTTVDISLSSGVIIALSLNYDGTIFVSTSFASVEAVKKTAANLCTIIYKMDE